MRAGSHTNWNVAPLSRCWTAHTRYTMPTAPYDAYVHQGGGISTVPSVARCLP